MYRCKQCHEEFETAEGYTEHIASHEEVAGTNAPIAAAEQPSTEDVNRLDLRRVLDNVYARIDLFNARIQLMEARLSLLETAADPAILITPIAPTIQRTETNQE